MSGKKAIKEQIQNAVITLMATTDIKDIRVKEVTALANICRSTFYLHYDSIDAVVQELEAAHLEAIRDLNRYFVSSKMDLEEPTKSALELTNLLYAQREFIKAINGPHGDPQFINKVNLQMKEFFCGKITYENLYNEYFDFQLTFAIAGNNSLIDHWLRKRPEVEPKTVAMLLTKFIYSVFLN